MHKCPVCSYLNISLKYRVSKYYYYYCSNCELLFLYPLFTRGEINKYYSQEFDYDVGIYNEKRIRERSKKILKRLKKINPHGQTLLDIGSGFGYFLDEAKKIEIIGIGIEPSKNIYVQSINRLNISVLNIHLNKFIKMYPYKKYDFITMIHVIEHLPNPLEAVRSISNLLSKSGILYIETPNFASWLSKFEKDKYIFLTPPEHLFIFSLKSLNYVIKKVPHLIIKKISSYSYPEHFMGIVKILLNKKKHKYRFNKNQLTTTKKNTSYIKKIKYFLFDKFLASLLHLLLDIDNKGSILELYIKKSF